MLKQIYLENFKRKENFGIIYVTLGGKNGKSALKTSRKIFVFAIDLIFFIRDEREKC